MRAATTRLIEGIIPDLALEIVFRCLKLKDDALNETETVQVLHTHLQHILHRMHTCGVNMRFLGALRSRFLVTAKQYDLHVVGHIDTVYSSLMFTEVRTAAPALPHSRMFWPHRVLWGRGPMDAISDGRAGGQEHDPRPSPRKDEAAQGALQRTLPVHNTPSPSAPHSLCDARGGTASLRDQHYLYYGGAYADTLTHNRHHPSHTGNWC